MCLQCIIKNHPYILRIFVCFCMVFFLLSYLQAHFGKAGQLIPHDRVEYTIKRMNIETLG